MTALLAAAALLPSGWAPDVRIEVEKGRIVSVAAGCSPRPGDERVGIVVPAMPNLHSHAFQRGMAGLAERRGPEADSFWSWRDTMYRFALAMTPDDVEAVAAMLYVEMLEAGFGRVGEFHYLHHDRDGRAYASIGEMAERVAAAAAATGIGLTLLPVLYVHSGFHAQPPSDAQRRFINEIDGFTRLLDASRSAVSGLQGASVGVAPHSLRAVAPRDLTAVAQLGAAGPIHIHVAEQTKEVEDCVAWSGARPVAWLLDNAPVDARWCLIHATHMTEDETDRLASSGAVAGLCPVTEANLGDGIFPGERFAAAGGAYGVGSDSNVLIGVADELRQLEYSQRLAHRRRNVLAPAGASNGRTLFDAALAGGNRALGGLPAGLVAGSAASFAAFDAADPDLAGRSGDALLDAWIFGGRVRPRTVWSWGRKVVADGCHVDRERIARRFAGVMAALAEG